MPRSTSEKCSRTNANPNKMMTRSAAAAAAAIITSPTIASSSTEEVPGNRPPTMDSCGVASTSASASATDQCPPRPEPAASPAKCAICLSDLANRCYTNSCIHQFCFGCLLEWSKIKPECPLCKSNFQSIYHNIRNNDDYDEYHIPQPANIVPHLSIRLTAESFRANMPVFRYDDPMRLPSPTLQLGVLSPPTPFHDHGYSFQRMIRERERERRQHQNNSYIRILEMGPFSEPRAIDLMNYSSGVAGRSVLDNPFYSDEPELFGAVDDSNANRIATETSLRGYQSRKRIYHRAQFVQPLAATLPAGTVFFPSVEYFQTHPSAISRISSWLYREIMALMGIHRSRNEMGYVYDMVLGLLPRYDIRSRDFREMVNSHFGIRTRHFQHEFYHFLISGMMMEEYDRLAHYTNPTSNNSTATATTNFNTASTAGSRRGTSRGSTNNYPSASSGGRPASPVTITIDSSDTESDSNPSVEALDSPNSSVREPRQMRRVFLPDMPNPDGSVRRNRPVPMPEAPIVLSTIPSPPPCRLSLQHSHNTLPNLGSDRSAIFRQALADQRGDTTMSSSSSLSGRRFPWDQARQPPVAHSNAGARVGNGSGIGDWESTLESLTRFRPPRSSAEEPTRYCPEPINAHRYSPRTREVFEGSSRTAALSPPTRTTDFERPRCPVETGYPLSGLEYVDPRSRPERYTSTTRRNNHLMYIFGPDPQISVDPPNVSISGTPGQFRQVSTHADPDAFLRRAGILYESQRHRTNPGAEQMKPKKTRSISPPRPVRLTPPLTVDDDEVEMLGVHPVVKPPPLAVITLSSDDEEDNLTKSKPKAEKSEGLPSLLPPMETAPSTVLTMGTSTPTPTVDFGTDDVIFHSERNGTSKDLLAGKSSSNGAGGSGLFGSSKSTGYLYKHGAHKPIQKNGGTKRVKHSVPETTRRQLSSTSSESSSSNSETEDEIYVESVSENRMTIKRRKGKKSHTHIDSARPRHGRKHGHRHRRRCEADRQFSGLSQHKTISLLSPSASSSMKRPEPTSTTLNKKRPRVLVLSDAEEQTSSESEWLASPKTLPMSSSVGGNMNGLSSYLGQTKTMLLRPSTSTPSASSCSMPSTIPGIGILDLRKLMDERKERPSSIATSGRPRSATLVRPSQVALPRWESDGSDVESELNIDENSTESKSDWNQKSSMKNQFESSTSEEEVDEMYQQSDDESSSSDTQYNSKKNSHGVTGGTSRGSFFIPNHPPLAMPWHNVPLDLPRTTTSDGTLDLRLNESSDPLLTWRNDPIVGRFDEDADGCADLLDLSLASGSLQGQSPPPTMSIYDAELSQSTSGGRRPSVDDSIDTGLNSRSSTADWFGDIDTTYKWGQSYK